jgi:putative colanic acid biosynthesis acetyltransferase WcaF
MRPANRRDLSKFSGAGYDKGRNRIWQISWLLADSLLVRHWWFPASARTRVLRFFGAGIGANVLIRHGVRIHWPWKLTVGDNSWIGVDTWILNLEPVEIGSDTCVSQSVLLCTGSHDRCSPTFEFDNAPVSIGSGVWIGTRATVLRGVEIGDDCTIGACCLVTKSLAPGTTLLSPFVAGIDPSI